MKASELSVPQGDSSDNCSVENARRIAEDGSAAAAYDDIQSAYKLYSEGKIKVSSPSTISVDLLEYLGNGPSPGDIREFFMKKPPFVSTFMKVVEAGLMSTDVLRSFAAIGVFPDKVCRRVSSEFRRNEESNIIVRIWEKSPQCNPAAALRWYLGSSEYPVRHLISYWYCFGIDHFRATLKELSTFRQREILFGNHSYFGCDPGNFAKFFNSAWKEKLDQTIECVREYLKIPDVDVELDDLLVAFDLHIWGSPPHSNTGPKLYTEAIKVLEEVLRVRKTPKGRAWIYQLISQLGHRIDDVRASQVVQICVRYLGPDDVHVLESMRQFERYGMLRSVTENFTLIPKEL